MNRHTQRLVRSFRKISDSPDSSLELLPPELLQISTSSMERIGEGRFAPREVSILQISLDDSEDSESQVLRIEPGDAAIPLLPSANPRQVVGVDASSIRLGETVQGELCAIRAALVVSGPAGASFLRIGPLAFHLTPAQTPLNGLQNFADSNGQSHDTGRQLYRLRNRLERWTQALACRLSPKSLILIDGSLTVGTPDNPASPVREILDLARRNSSRVLGLSKSTRLQFSGRSALNLLAGDSPGLVDITDLIESQFPSSPVSLLGWVFVARLASDGFPFRLDIDRELRREEAIESVRVLVKSDLVYQGYPETLRVAHILSTFTANEVIGLQRFISHKYGLKMTDQPDIRRLLFGPFGTSRGTFH